MQKLLRLWPILLFASFFWQAGAASGIPIRYYGSLNCAIVLDPAAYFPDRTSAYPWVQRTYSSSPSIWSNRFDLRIEGGTQGGNIYFIAPLRLRFATHDYPGEKRRTYRLYNEKWDSTMFFRVGTEKFRAALTQHPNFTPKGLLGNFRSTNRTSFWTGQPDLGLKVEGWPSNKWSILFNAFQTEGNDYVPYAETIPQAAAELRTGATGEGPKVGTFAGAREGRVTYLMGAVEGGGLLQSSDSWGVYLGTKYVSNPGFAANPQDQGAQRVQKYNGKDATLNFSKNALEVNWQGRLKQGKLSLAAAKSVGIWQLYQREANGLATFIDLGQAGGAAYAVNLEDEVVGPGTISANFYFVDPDYQWVLARHPGLAYAYTGRGEYSGKQDSENRFPYLDRARASRQLSDVSRYLGRSSKDLAVSIPGAIGSKPAMLTFKLVANRWLDPLRRIADWDPELDLFSKDDYHQFDAKIKVICSRRDVVSFYGLNRHYDAEMTSWLRGLGVDWQRQVSPQITWNTALDYRYRFLSEEGQGAGSGARLKSSLEGRSDRGALVRFAAELRQGNYDFGLLTPGHDRVLSRPYDYFQIELYAKHSRRLTVGNVSCNLTVGGQFWSQKSSLADVIDGSSLIGYSQVTIPWLGARLSQDISLIAAKGPDDPSMPTGYVTPALDNSLRFQLGGNSSFTMRTTYYPDTALAVTSAQFQIGLSRGGFTVSYGYWENSEANWGRYARYEVAEMIRTENPLTGKKWDEWNYWWVAHRVKEGYRNVAYPNHFIISYTVNF